MLQMRRLSTLVLLAWCVSPVLAVGRIAWLDTRHSLGEIMESRGKVSYGFSFVNVGDDDVVINHVRSSCGCSFSDYPRRPVAPGDTATIVATFNPAARPGDFNTFFTVITNAEPHRTTLELSGKVIADELTVNEKYPVAVGSLKLNAGSVPFGELTEGGTQTAAIEAYNDSDVPVKFYVDELPGYVSVTPRQAIVAPRSRHVIMVGFDTDRCNRRGYVSTDFNLFAEPVKREAGVLAGIKRIDVMAIVYDDFASWSDERHRNAPEIAFDADRLVFADIDTLSAKPLKKQLTITNRGNDPLKIYGISAADKCIAIGSFKESLGKDESTVVDISLIPDEITGKILNTSIIIYCNDPRRAKSAVRIVGNEK